MSLPSADVHPPHELNDTVQVHSFALVPSIDKSPGGAIVGKPLPIFGSCSGKATSLVNVLEVSGHEERRDGGLIISSAIIPSHL